MLTQKTRNGTGATFIRAETTYTTDQNYVSTQTDARNKVVTSNINPTTGALTSVTDPNNQTVSYTYDTLKRVTGVQTTAGGKTYKNAYVYADDKLVTVSHNTGSDAACDVTYHFEYDAQNRPTVVKVGEQALSTNVYNTTAGDPLYGTLTETTFGNGGSVRNTYDAFKRVVGVRYDDDTTDRYRYDFGANGQVAKLTDRLLGRTAESEYDAASRPMRVIYKQGDDHLYTGEVSYDQYNNLASFREQVGVNKTAYRTDFTYDKENKPTLMTFGDADNKVAYAYDALGRMVTRTATVGGNASASTYAYVAGGFGTGSTTALIASITQGNDESCAYVYDDVGNITAATRGNATTTYAYDNLGQLIRVNDPSDTSAGVTGTTWVYAYDRGGNILSKKKYALTDAATSALANQTPLQTISYNYDTTWKDKLTSYNGQSITYDQIGNPLSDGAWAYTWEKGRQLKRMVKGVEGAAGYESLDYAYNAEGLRIRKTHTVYDADAEANVVTTTEYTLHGKNVVQMTRTRDVFDGDGAPVPNTDTVSDSLHFWYDAQNKPAIVEWSATDADNVTTTAKYAYIHNLQGDIVGIRDVNGTEVVRYTYDAWGKLLTTTGSLASTLGCLNPFRYRGYVYDEETGLYYLRSRYYNPTWGRFVNADDCIGTIQQLFSHNIFAYCANNPTQFIDRSGRAKELSTDNLCEFGANDWGTHTTQLPVSTLLKVLTQIERDGDWNYKNGALKYKLIDCIGLILIAAKFHFTYDAFRKTYNIGTGTNSAIANGNTTDVLEFDGDPSSLKIGTIMYCNGLSGEERGHVGIYVGYYVDRFGTVYEHAVIHCQGGANSGVVVESLIGSRFSAADAEYTEYNYLLYDMVYSDTHPALRYVVTEEW